MESSPVRENADMLRDAAENDQQWASVADRRSDHEGTRRPSYPSVQWARRSYLELGALPTAVPCARGHARLVVGEWGLAAMAETIELLVSELVTNGLRASA